MSLKVWLPLNGDLRNNGFYELPELSLNTLSIENNGKIGKCYKGSGIYNLSNDDLIENQWSICMWTKLGSVGVNNNILFCKNDALSTSCHIYFSVINNTYINLGINGGSSDNAGSFAYTFDTTKWYHLAATYDGVKWCIYINGELFKTGTTSAPKINDLNNIGIGCRSTNSAGTNQTGQGGNRCYNDFRIYDHALSLKEVKEISKGLILHYPLNRDGIGQNNIIKNSDKGIGLIGSDYGSITTHNFDSATGIGRIEIISDTGKWNRWRFGKKDLETNPVELTSGVTTYTFSLDIRVTNYTTGTIALTFDFRTNNIVHSIAQYILTNAETDGQWHRVSASLTTNKQNDTECLFCITSKSTVGNIGMVIEYKHFKLEMGSIATPWCPNSSDELATALGMNDDVVHDTSGFEYDSVAENLVVKNSNNIPNILSSTAVTIKNWTNINPDCMVLSIRESNPNKNRVFVKQALSGKWKNVYSPAITVTANQEYTLSCYYRVYDSYTFKSSYGDFGLTVMTSAPSNANPINNTIARIPFPNTITGSTKGSVTFTPTVDTIYLNICGGSITDGQLGKTFDIDYIQLEEGDTTTEYVEPVRYNRFTVFNGSNSHILGESISSEALTASCWIYPKNTSSQICFIDYKSGLSFGMWNSQYIICSCKSNLNQAYPLTDLILNRWNHIVVQKNLTDSKMDLYINGVKQTVLRTDYWSSNMTDKLTIGARMNGTNPFNGYMSDFRIYASALTQNQILELYRNTTSVDKDNNFYSYEYDEMYQGNEIEYLYDLTKSNSGTFLQDKDGLHLDQQVWITHTYIPINPTEKTYKYDITYSCDAGNQFYIGWERYDANKTSRSNNACVYVVARKPSIDVVKSRAKGTIDLSTDGVNPCAFIKLRILNKWTGSDSNTQGKATIHSLSLKEYSNDNVLTPLNHTKQGIVNTTELLEKDIGVSINDTYELSSNIFYEI